MSRSEADRWFTSPVTVTMVERDFLQRHQSLRFDGAVAQARLNRFLDLRRRAPGCRHLPA